MVQDSARLLEAVLALPPEDRVNFALRVLESVDGATKHDVVSSREEWDEAWSAEIEARIAENEPSVPLADVIAELRGRRA